MRDTHGVHRRAWLLVGLTLLVGLALASPGLTKHINILNVQAANQVGASISGGAVVAAAVLYFEVTVCRIERARTVRCV